VILPSAPKRGEEFRLTFHYAGRVIRDSGNGVYFVGARESWYPHLGDASDFSLYEMTMRWPRRLRLAATGTKLDEKEDGDFHVGHWKTDTPAAVAGFNLGTYESRPNPTQRRDFRVAFDPVAFAAGEGCQLRRPK